ncbi:hypothetical protein OC834_007175 [Tilletia horrida]|nr:hypothetical protein OC834_007175 [Tilletia horrida]
MEPSAKRRRGSASPETATATTQCIICLTDDAVDRTLLPACAHSAYCFLCIVGWATLPRSHASGSGSIPSCPLCKTAIGPYVLHHLRGKDDASRYYLRPPPLESSQFYAADSYSSSAWQRSRSRRSNHRPSSRPTPSEDDPLEQTLAFRRRVYSHLVFSKHVASNRCTRWKPLPPPSAFRSESSSSSSLADSNVAPPTVGVSNWSPARLQSRALAFLRRELLVFPHLTLDSASPSRSDPHPRRTVNAVTMPSLSFVTTYIFSLLQTLDLRSDMMTRLLAEFLCPPPLRSTSSRSSAHMVELPSSAAVAELFAHELASWLRSPYRRLEDWDRSEWLQYDFSGIGPVVTEANPDSQRTMSRFAPSVRERRRSNGRRSISPQPAEDRSEAAGTASSPKSQPSQDKERALDMRKLRSHLLNRLEAERALAKSHLAARLAQEQVGSLQDGGAQDGQVDEVERERHLREVLLQRRVERRQLAQALADVVADVGPGPPLELARSNASPSAKVLDGQIQSEREAALRALLRSRHQSVLDSTAAQASELCTS